MVRSLEEGQNGRCVYLLRWRNKRKESYSMCEELYVKGGELEKIDVYWEIGGKCRESLDLRFF